MEKWLIYKGYDNHAISSEGKVRIEKSIFAEMVGHTKSIQYNHTTGYCHVKISGEAGAKTFALHRLVAELFCEKPEVEPGVKLEVDHINKDRRDNRAENLRWVTRKQQMANVTPRPFKRPIEVEYQNGDIEFFSSIKDAAEQLTVTQKKVYSTAGISNILAGKLKEYKGLKFRYTTDRNFLKFLRSGLSLKEYLEKNPGKDLNSNT